MMCNPIPEDLLRQVTPKDARAYAAATGWERVASNGGPLAVFRRPGRDLDQLLIPSRARLDDYVNRIREAVEKLCEIEGRSAQSILNDILTQDADVLRYQVVSSRTERGSLPLVDGLALLEGARRSILAAACSVVNPQRSHPRLSRTEADQLVRACELGQTERGSYTVLIACPLRAVEPSEAISAVENKPFTRRVTELLYQSVSRIVRAIERDQPRAALDQVLGEPSVSANLCDALLRMRPDIEGASLSFGVSWAPSGPLLDSHDWGEPLELDYEHFPMIEDLYARLQPERHPEPNRFMGQVDELRGELGDDGRRYGEVVLSVLPSRGEEDLIRARVNLSPEQYELADRVHMSGGFITISGVLRRSRRIGQLTDVTAFSEIPQESASRDATGE